jgi:hypothetical protein
VLDIYNLSDDVLDVTPTIPPGFYFVNHEANPTVNNPSPEGLPDAVRGCRRSARSPAAAVVQLNQPADSCVFIYVRIAKVRTRPLAGDSQHDVRGGPVGRLGRGAMVRQSSVSAAGWWLRVLVMMAALLALSAALPATRAVAETPSIGSHAAVLGSPNSGNLAVFFNSNGTLEENFYFVSSNTWSGPMVLPGSGITNLDSPQAVGSPNGGNMAVFYTVSGALKYDIYLVSSNTWSGPFQVSPDIQGDPAVVGSPNGGNMAVFWRDSHNHLNEDFYFAASNTWGGAFSIATAIDDSPVAIGSPDSGNLAVFYTSNGILLESYYLGSQNSWIGPFQLATQVKGPAAVLGSPDSGNIAVFYTAVLSNGTSQLREVFYTVASNSWGGPFQVPGSPANGPVAAIGSPNSGNIAVFFDNVTNGVLEQDLYQVATNSWTGATAIGSIAVAAQPAAVGDANGGNRAVFFTDGPSTAHPFALTLNYFFGSTGTWSGPMVIGGQIS